MSLIKELHERYPDKIICDLDRITYKRIWFYAKNQNMHVSEYLMSLGFIHDKLGEHQLIKELELQFPDKKISNIDANLYEKISRIAKRESVSAQKYLETRGFSQD